MRELKGFVVTQHIDSLSANQFPHRRQDTKPEDVREFLDAKKKSKIDLVIFQDKCKKNYSNTHLFRPVYLRRFIFSGGGVFLGIRSGVAPSASSNLYTISEQYL